jgi:hypothetical protein
MILCNLKTSYVIIVYYGAEWLFLKGYEVTIYLSFRY